MKTVSFYADRGTRTLTRLPLADFESAASAIPPHPRESAMTSLTYQWKKIKNKIYIY